MKLNEILEFFRIYDVRNCSFCVDVIGSDCLSFLCYMELDGSWMIVDKFSYAYRYHCFSRLDCLECLNYFYGLPF